MDLAPVHAFSAKVSWIQPACTHLLSGHCGSSPRVHPPPGHCEFSPCTHLPLEHCGSSPRAHSLLGRPAARAFSAEVLWIDPAACTFSAEALWIQLLAHSPPRHCGFSLPRHRGSSCLILPRGIVDPAACAFSAGALWIKLLHSPPRHCGSSCSILSRGIVDLTAHPFSPEALWIQLLAHSL